MMLFQIQNYFWKIQKALCMASNIYRNSRKGQLQRQFYSIFSVFSFPKTVSHNHLGNTLKFLVFVSNLSLQIVFSTSSFKLTGAVVVPSMANNGVDSKTVRLDHGN